MITIFKKDFNRDIIEDSYPDLSWIGEYSNNPGPDDRTIDREENGDIQRGEYQYFIAALSGKDTGNPDSVAQDYHRMEEINKGEICFYGIRASVELKIPHRDHFILQTIKSPGLWGIESDGDNDYFNEVFQEESAILIDMLKKLNVEVTDV